MAQFRDFFNKYVGQTFDHLPVSNIPVDRKDGALEALRKEATANNMKLYVEWPNTVNLPFLRDCFHVQVEQVDGDTYQITDNAKYHPSHFGNPEVL